MSEFFKSICYNTCQYEGGYTDGRGDHGGETYLGISRRWHPKWPGWVEIDRVKALRPIKQGESGLVDLAEVLKFYRQEFWDKLLADQIPDRRIPAMLFDHAVTAGVADAVKLIQGILGVKQDGIMGPVTIGEIRASIRDMGPVTLLRKLFLARMQFYVTEAEKSGLQEANLPSWTRRTLAAYSGSI